MKNKKKLSIVILSVVLVLCLASTALTAQSVLKTAPPPVEATVRDETIYCNLNIDGSIKKSSAVVHLTMNDFGTYTDSSAFTNVVNLSDLSVQQIPGNDLAWEFTEAMQNFYYQGDLSSHELPFTFKFSYELDGQSVADPSGVTGRLKTIIEIISNTNAQKAFIDNYMCQMQFPVDIEACLNIDSGENSGVLIGKTRTYAFTVLPGSSGSYELSFDVNNYSAASATITLLAYDISSAFDVTSATDGVMDLYNGIEEMHEGTDNLAAGISELSRGLDEITTNMTEVESGYTQLYDGLKSGLEQTGQLTSAGAGINAGLSQLSGGMKQLDENGKQLKAGLSAGADTTELTQAMTQLTALLSQSQTLSAEEKQAMLQLVQGIGSGLSESADGMTRLQGGLTQYIDGVSAMNSQLPQLQAGVKQYTDGVSAIVDGVDQAMPSFELLNDGTAQLADGLSLISENIEPLPEGFDKMLEGQLQLMEGVLEFDEMLKETTSSEKVEIIPSFTNGGSVNSVQFVIRTAEIMGTETEAAVEPEAIEIESFWSKLSDLFK